MFEPPSQTSFEMYHARRHRAQRGRGASLRARARSGDDLAVARGRNLRNEDFYQNASSRLTAHPRAMLRRAALRLLWPSSNERRGGSLFQQWAGLSVLSMLLLLAALSDGSYHRQRHRRALKIPGGLAGRQLSISEVFTLCPPARTLCSSWIPRALPRSLVCGRRQRSFQTFTVALDPLGGCQQNFNGVERARSCVSTDDPQRVWMLSVCCMRWPYRTHMYRGACERGGHGGQGRPDRGVEKPCGWQIERGGSCLFF